LHGGFLFFNSADIGPARTLAEAGGEIGEFIGWSGGVDFDAAVIQIAGVASETEGGCGLLGEVAEADALDASANHPAAGCTGFSGHASGL
jgi:predicted transcriptional regulator